MLTLTASQIVTLAPVSRLPAAVLGRIKLRLSFQNPAWLDAQRRGFSTWNIPKQITGLGQGDDALIIPRGFVRQLIGVLRGAGVQYRVEDRRRTLAPVDFAFRGYEVEPETATLSVGDYSLPGFEDRAAVERKGLEDLIGGLMDAGRERFKKELARARHYEPFTVVVEALEK